MSGSTLTIPANAYGNITVKASWTINTYYATLDQSLGNSALSTGSFGSNGSSGSWTHSDGLHTFKISTNSTSGSFGPFISYIAGRMVDGVSYRVTVVAKASRSVTISMKVEAAASNKTKNIALTTSYQTFTHDIVYDACATYKALTFYSTNWLKDEELTI